MKTNLLAVSVVVVSLSGFSAFADGFHSANGYPNGNNDDRNEHRATPVRPNAPPPSARQQQGQYVLQSTQQWVPGAWVVSQPVCTTQQHGRHGRTVTRCSQPSNQWVAAHYEMRQQWVWLPAPAPVNPWERHHHDHNRGPNVAWNGSGFGAQR